MKKRWLIVVKGSVQGLLQPGRPLWLVVAGFLHVGLVPFGTQASLSGFLTGETIPDPVVPATSRTFGELEARAIKLAQFAGSVCKLRPILDGPVRGGVPLPPILHRPSLRAH